MLQTDNLPGSSAGHFSFNLPPPPISRSNSIWVKRLEVIYINVISFMCLCVLLFGLFGGVITGCWLFSLVVVNFWPQILVGFAIAASAGLVKALILLRNYLGLARDFERIIFSHKHSKPFFK